MGRIVWALLALAFGATPGRAETRQFGNLVYEVPSGWEVGAAEKGVQYLLSDLPDDRCRFCQVMLGPARMGADDPLAILGAEKLRFIEPEDAATAKEMIAPRSLKFGNGRLAAITGILAGGDVHVTLAVRLTDRVQLYGFRGDAGEPEDAKETLDVFGTQIAPFLERIAYVSEGAESLLPAPVPGPLAGLWWGWRDGWSSQIDGTMRYDMVYRTLVFWGDGQVYDGTPPAGLAPLDRAALLAAGDTDFGVYRVEGDTLRLTFSDGRTETLPREGDGWKDGLRKMQPGRPLEDGARLDGTISRSYTTGFGVGTSGGMTSLSSTTFHPDGSYEGSSYSGAFGNFTNSVGDLTAGFATGASGDEGGRYEIRNGLLILHPRDGRTPNRVLVYRAFDDIMVGSLVLKR